MTQPDTEIGDVSERRELRNRLQCHSFAWYMMHVMPERFLPADQVAHGQVSMVGHRCYNSRVAAAKCCRCCEHSVAPANVHFAVTTLLFLLREQKAVLQQNQHCNDKSCS